MRSTFDEQDVAVIGLHSVFGHHDVMTAKALEAFVHEYRIQFPAAIDQPAPRGAIPLTMEQYRLRGTPTLLLIDRQGRLRLNRWHRRKCTATIPPVASGGTRLAALSHTGHRNA